jgi:hypothetical protein
MVTTTPSIPAAAVEAEAYIPKPIVYEASPRVEYVTRDCATVYDRVDGWLSLIRDMTTNEIIGACIDLPTAALPHLARPAIDPSAINPGIPEPAREEIAALIAERDEARIRMAVAEAERDEARRSSDGAYLERNRLVVFLTTLYPAGVKDTAIDGWDPEWNGCVYIDLPTGQASWHFHEIQRHLFAHLPPYAGEWDGHTTEEKYERIARLPAECATIAALAEERDEALADAKMAIGLEQDTWARCDAAEAKTKAAETERDALAARVAEMSAACRASGSRIVDLERQLAEIGL